MNIKWDKYRYFYYVADERSLTRAAARLNMSQTTLSKHIKDLEYSLNKNLFVRRLQGMELTRAGEKLYLTVKNIYDKTEKISKDFRKEEKEPEGELRVLTTPGIASSWLMQYIPGFHRNYPKVHLTIIGSLKVEETPFNAGIIKIIPKQSSSYSIIEDYLTTFNQNLYASEKYLELHGMPQTIKDLKNHKMISYESKKSGSLRGNTNWFMAGNDNSVLTVDSALGLYYAAISDMGIVELPENYPLLKSSNLKLIKLKESSPYYDVYFSYLRENKRSEEIRVFTSYLKNEIIKENTN